MAKDPAQQSKMLNLLNIYTKGAFSNDFRYSKSGKGKGKDIASFNLKDFTLGNMNAVPAFIR